MAGNRRSIRLEDYDYAQKGAYYVTVCANDRKCMFGQVRNCKMVLNDAGKMVGEGWGKLPNRFPNIEIDEFIVMPNHLHGIINIIGKCGTNENVGALPLVEYGTNDAVGAPLVGALNHDSTIKRATIKVAPTLGEIIGAFKSITTNEYIRSVETNNWPSFNKHFWQRNFYEHVIRDESELTRIREYIINNPAHWEEDEYFSPK